MGPFLVVLAATAGSPSIEWKTCPTGLAADAKCGTVQVPEDRSRAGGRRIGLNVIVLPALGTVTLPALVDVEGGPGNASTDSAAFYAGDGKPYRANRDVLLVDQRGTGGSNLLACPELAASLDRPLYPVAKVAQCRTRLSSSADLRFYGTSDAVKDLDDVRGALAYENLDLTGISYGTTFALRYIDTYPDRVRAAVLIAPVPTSARPPRDHAILANAQLNRLLADCRADKACGSKFDPSKDFSKALKRLAGGQREVFMEVIRTAMYVPSTARTIPYIVHQAASGNFKPWRQLAPRGRGGFGEGVYLSITCGENFPGMKVAAARRAARATLFGDYRLRRQQQACQHWPGARIASDHFLPVRADVPALILTGTDDPVASEQWAQQLTRELPAASLVEMRGAGHGLDGVDGLGECFDTVALQFFADPRARNHDAACFTALRAPSFKVTDKDAALP
jgi:pimeloyl-ACP methyl ester carboxylesterase